MYVGSAMEPCPKDVRHSTRIELQLAHENISPESGSTQALVGLLVGAS
jgi:hypothetical protein